MRTEACAPESGSNVRVGSCSFAQESSDRWSAVDKLLDKSMLQVISLFLFFTSIWYVYQGMWNSLKKKYKF